MLHRAWTIGLCLWLMAGAVCGAQPLASDQRSFAAADTRSNPEELTIIGRPNFWREQRKFEKREFDRLDKIFGRREQQIDVIGKALAGDGGVLCKRCTMADILTKEAVRGRSAW